MTRTKLFKLTKIIIITAFLITACEVEEVSKNQLRLARFAVKKDDLPIGWTFSNQDWNQHLGGEEFSVAYGVPDDGVIRFVHAISFYPAEEDADEAYPKWENEVFNGAWEPWDEANFKPQNSNDLFRFECLQLTVDSPVVSCLYLQLHNQFVSYVLVNLDSEAMTFEQLNEILAVLDRRLNEVSMDD